MPSALSVDVEECFHSTELHEFSTPGDWSTLPARLPKRVGRILDLLDGHGVRATVVLLGWEVERHPNGVRRIAPTRTYFGIRGMIGKLRRLLKDFACSPISSVHPLPIMILLETIYDFDGD